MVTEFDNSKRLRSARGTGPVVAEAFAWVALLTMDAAKWTLELAKRGATRVKAARSRLSQPKQMRVLETLALGGKRQLFLVTYEGHRYLVGAGADDVGTIVALDAGTDTERARAEAAKVEAARDTVAHMTRAAQKPKDLRGLELVRHRPGAAGVRKTMQTRPMDAQAGLELWQ